MPVHNRTDVRARVHHLAYDSLRMPARARITVVIVDDHRAFGEALAIALDKERDLEVVAIETDGASAAHVAATVHPDVVLLDLEMPGIGGLEVSPRIRDLSADTSIIILTGSEDELAHGRAVEAGARGFLQKTATISEVADAVRRAHRGEPLNPEDEVAAALERVRRVRTRDGDMERRLDRLTPRELEILQLLADGRSPEEITGELDLSRHTLRTHVQNVLMKLGVHSKLDAIVAAIRHGKVRTTNPANDPEPVAGTPRTVRKKGGSEAN
jgi:DNA-binding NarL/FixJ family response regulator